MEIFQGKADVILHRGQLRFSTTASGHFGIKKQFTLTHALVQALMLLKRCLDYFFLIYKEEKNRK